VAGKPGRRWGELRGEYAEVRQFAATLRDVADSHGVTLRILESRMTYGHSAISLNLSGVKRPDWDFVTAFLGACAGNDRHARAVLERKVRPLWDAAAPALARRVAEVALPTPAELQPWIAALRDAANAQQVVANVQLSVGRHQALVGGLLEMLSRLTMAAETLTAERDEFAARLRDHTEVARELSEARTRLDETQQRLDAAEKLQAETSRRLDVALHQLEEAEQLKYDAISQAAATRKRLARLERSAITAPVDPEGEDPPGEGLADISLMGKADQEAAVTILQRVDDALGAEAASLEGFRSDMDKTGRAGQRSGGLSADNASTSPDNASYSASADYASSQVVWTTRPTGRSAGQSEDDPAAASLKRNDLADSAHAEPRRGQIVTFYSFKGGTGRTMALANVAWILAANGFRVLVADWDLESPHLHRYYQPFMDPGVSERPGIVEFVRRYEWAASDAMIPPEALDSGPETARQSARAAVRQLIREHIHYVHDCAVALHWPFFSDGGELHFLSPGRWTTEYQPALSALDWDTFYDRLHGGQFFDAFRDHLKAHFDYVLIDCRTGLSDMTDLCTVHLPDVVVNCFTLSTQAIDGAATIAKSIRSHPERKITIWPVPMRIDHTRQVKAADGLEFAQRQLAGLPAAMSAEERRAYWDEVQVPYKPSYAYEETLAVFGDRPDSRNSLLSAYERITARITGGEVTALPPRDEWKRLRTGLLFSRSPEAVSPPEIVLDFSPEDQLWAEWIASVLAEAGIAIVSSSDTAADSPAGPGGPAHVVAVMSEAYIRKIRDFPPAVTPDLLIAIDEHRISSAPVVAEVPAIFLAGRSEGEAIAMLIDRLGGHQPTEPTGPDLRYPGVERAQVLNIPARNVNFTGRDTELRQLRDLLRSHGVTAVPPVTIQGLGGIGKTQLAIEYAHRFKADYDIVWWLNCGQSQYVDASLGDLGSRLREEFAASIPEEGGEFELAQQVLAYLSAEETESRWLLIYDNAEDVDYISQLTPKGGGHVLITSRDDRWRRHGGRSLTTGVFRQEESISHLRRRMPGIPDAEASQVAEVLGNMPLAVAAAGALLAEMRITVAEYLRELAVQPSLDLAGNDPLSDYPPAVARAWNLSLDYLVRRSPAAARLLMICSSMAPDISQNLVRSQAMAEAVRTLDPTITERAMIARLIRQVDLLALLKTDNITHQIQVHRVVQTVVNQRLTEGERRARQRDVHQILVKARPDGDVDDPRMWPKYRTIWPHLTASDAVRSVEREVRDLVLDRVRYLRQRDDLERGARRVAEIEEAWEAMLAQDQAPREARSLREQLLRLRFTLANILREQGKFREARAVDAEVLKEQRMLLGDEHPHTLQTRSSLAADLRALGDYNAALDLDRETYQSWAENSGFGDDDPGTLSAAHNLAVSYLVTGDFRNALLLDRQTLERRATVYSEKHPRTLNSEASLARGLLEAGRYREAATRLQKVWDDSREVLGDNDRSTLVVRMWLGIARRCAGSPEAAATHIDAARLGLTRGFGRDSIDTLSCRLSQAVNSLALGRAAQAAAQAEELLATFEAKDGPSHPHSLICRLNIAAAMFAQEQFAEAAVHARRAADGLRGRLGADHPYTLSSMMMLANVLAQQGELAPAAELEQYVTDRRVRTLGPQHPDTLRSQANQLLTRHEMGDTTASAERQAVIAGLGRLLTIDHPDVTTAIGGHRLLCVVVPQPFLPGCSRRDGHGGPSREREPVGAYLVENPGKDLREDRDRVEVRDLVLYL
jgi:cellulose biosynthesis protein BcsQ/tetratricopeptide (TPR) repeat protein